MNESGLIAWPSEAAERMEVACAIAGVLAESGVGSLDVNDARACRGWSVATRETDLPGVLMGSAPGTTLSGAGVALLIDEAEIKWVAGEAIAAGLREIGAVRPA